MIPQRPRFKAIAPRGVKVALRRLLSKTGSFDTVSRSASQFAAVARRVLFDRSNNLVGDI